MKHSIGFAATTVLAATGLAVAALMSGCSSSSSGHPAAGGGGGGSAGTSVAAAAVGGASSSAGAANGGCKQLTSAEVQPLILDTVQSVVVTAITADGLGQQCEFDAKGADSTGSITVQVIGGSEGTTAYAQEVSDETKPVAVTGVGDKASRDTEDGQINAIKGNLYCSVSYSANDLIPGVPALEEAHGATNNIGENYWDAVAQALGTLCNRIYGSGNTTPDLSLLTQADATASPSDDGGLPTDASLPTDGSS